MRQFENGETNWHSAHRNAAGNVAGVGVLSAFCPRWLPDLENRRAL